MDYFYYKRLPFLFLFSGQPFPAMLPLPRQYTPRFDLPVGNRRLPPKFTDTATRRQHVPTVNFKKFRRNLEFSKKIEIN